MNDIVSIVITTCKGGRKLLRAVKSALNQTYLHTEIIVVDDNGRNTREQIEAEGMLKGYIDDQKIQYLVHENNRNGAVARNTGVSVAKGDFISFLDDDDVYYPERIEKLYNAINKGEYVAAYSDVIFLYNDAPDRILTIQANGLKPEQLYVNHSLIGTGSNIFVKKDVYVSLQGFDESFMRHQDIEFMIRVLEKGDIIGINEILVMKDNSTLRFFPEYSRFKETQRQYFEKFKQIEDGLDEKIMDDFILNRKKDLLLASYLSKDKKNIEEARGELNSEVGTLSVVDDMRIRIKGIYMQYIYTRIPAIRSLIHKARAIELSQRNSYDVKKALEILMNIS